MSTAVGVCAICLQLINPEHEAFCDPCFHHFCFDCIRDWTETQQRSNTSPTCPLCKQLYQSIIYNCHDLAFTRLDVSNTVSNTSRCSKKGTYNGGSSSAQLQLTAALRRRRSLYFMPERYFTTLKDQVQGSAINVRALERPQVLMFIQRELQAILLVEDVDIVAHHVFGTLKHTAQQYIQSQAAPTLVLPASEILDTLIPTLEPYMQQLQAEQCVYEVVDFLASGNSIFLHDLESVDTVVLRQDDEEQDDEHSGDTSSDNNDSDASNDQGDKTDGVDCDNSGDG